MLGGSFEGPRARRSDRDASLHLRRISVRPGARRPSVYRLFAAGSGRAEDSLRPEHGTARKTRCTRNPPPFNPLSGGQRSLSHYTIAASRSALATTPRRDELFASPRGSKGELTAPAFERSQRVGEGGPRQPLLSLADGGGRIDARPEKAACAFERAPRVGSTDAPPRSASRGPESTQHARDRRSSSASSPAAARLTSRPGVHRAPSGRPLAGRKIPLRVRVCQGMPASGWIRDRPGCRRTPRGAVPARRLRTAGG